MSSHTITKLTQGYLVNDAETGNQYAFNFEQKKDVISLVVDEPTFIRALANLDTGGSIKVEYIRTMSKSKVDESTANN